MHLPLPCTLWWAEDPKINIFYSRRCLRTHEKTYPKGRRVKSRDSQLLVFWYLPWNITWWKSDFCGWLLLIPSAPHLLSKQLRRHTFAKLPSTRVNSAGAEVLSQTSRTSRRSGLANTKHIQILPRVFSCHYLPRKQLLELPQGDSVIMYRKGINQANSLFSCLPSMKKVWERLI